MSGLGLRGTRLQMWLKSCILRLWSEAEMGWRCGQMGGDAVGGEVHSETPWRKFPQLTCLAKKWVTELHLASRPLSLPALRVSGTKWRAKKGLYSTWVEHSSESLCKFQWGCSLPPTPRPQWTILTLHLSVAQGLSFIVSRDHLCSHSPLSSNSYTDSDSEVSALHSEMNEMLGQS